MKEDIIVYSRLVAVLDKCKVLVFSKGGCNFEFVRDQKGWRFGNALFQTSDLVRLIVKAEDEDFSVFMRA